MKKSYLVTTLQPGERIFYQGQPHPAYLLPHALVALGFEALLLWGIAALGLAGIIPWVGWVLVLPVLYFLSQLVVFLTTESALTSDRVLVKSGWLRRQISEIQLGKVESMAIDQGLFGRLLGFADLHIHGSGGHAVTALAVAHVMRFRAAVQNAITQRASRGPVSQTASATE